MTTRPTLIRGDDDELLELDDRGGRRLVPAPPSSPPPVVLPGPVAPAHLERFAELEAGGRKELERAHRLELVEHLELVRLRFAASGEEQDDEALLGAALGLAIAARELREWPPATGIE